MIVARFEVVLNYTVLKYAELCEQYRDIRFTLLLGFLFFIIKVTRNGNTELLNRVQNLNLVSFPVILWELSFFTEIWIVSSVMKAVCFSSQRGT